LNLSSSQENENIWQQVFEASVKEQDSFKYVVSRTLRRPRETIQFCNRALRFAQDLHHSKISADDILSAEIQYSAEKIRDLASEFLVQYPYLDGLFGLFQGFKPSFTRDEFESRYQEAKDRLERNYLDLQSLSSEGILQILYNIGFLGAVIDSAYVFFYNMPNLTLPQQEKYIIHPAFHAALGIQERVIALNDFQSVYIKAEVGQNVGGIFRSGGYQQVAFGDVSVPVGRSLGYEQEEITELLTELVAVFRQSGLAQAQVEKALIRLESAREEVIESEPDKELIAKSIQRALRTIQENSVSGEQEAEVLREIRPILRQLSRWLGVSSKYFGV
jgi:hypothetical protein